MQRRFLLALAALVLSIVGLTSITYAQSKPTEIRIGYQAGGLWTLLKEKGTLESIYGSDVKISWSLFPSGPPLLEALNAGAIDIGATGETPPVFAQAAGVPLVYVAVQSGNGAGSAILVPQDSPLKTVADLKGKTVAFTKASSANLLIVKALQKFGLSYSDITPALLQPPDARAAFTGGSIDAWVVWDPFRAAAIKELNARPLIEGQDVSPTKSYVEASNTFVTQYPDVVKTIITELQKATAWVLESDANKDEYSQVVGKATGLDPSIIRTTVDAEFANYYWIDDATIAYQQNVADIFFNLGLIPEQLSVKDVSWVGGTNPAPDATADATTEATAEATASS